MPETKTFYLLSVFGVDGETDVQIRSLNPSRVLAFLEAYNHEGTTLYMTVSTYTDNPDSGYNISTANGYDNPDEIYSILKGEAQPAAPEEDPQPCQIIPFVPAAASSN